MASGREGGGGGKRPEDESRDMRVVRRIADGFAHEMNNVFAAIIGRASVLYVEIEDDSPAHQDVEAILAAGRIGLQLTKDLLSFSGETSSATRVISTNELVGKVVAGWERSIEHRVEIKSDLQRELKPIKGNPAQIRQMLIHLGVNAIQAMPNGGTLTFTTKNQVVDPKLDSLGLEPGEYVRIQVADSGEGMDAQTVREAFEPFFTTKPTPTSTGLGLSFVYQTVKSHGGQVRLFSKKGLGTTVTIYLPVVEVEAVEPSVPELQGPQNAKQVILLVDDDPHVLGTGARLLTKLGYGVITACEGLEALEHYQERGDSISLALVDLIMPAMSGLELMRQLKKLDPKFGVIVYSASPDEGVEVELMEAGADGFLPKPYTLKQLSHAIRAVLRPAARAPTGG